MLFASLSPVRQPYIRIYGKPEKNRNSVRSGSASAARGQSLAELSAALVLMTPLVLATIDGLSICVGAAINDTTCRDAARAAASGPPAETTLGTRTVASGQAPYKRARAVVEKVYQTNLPMKIREVISVKETVKDYPPATMGGGSLDGEVSVETTIDIYPPFLVKSIVGPSGISLKTKHIVPYTYTIAASAGGGV
jgi:hypothetical protein